MHASTFCARRSGLLVHQLPQVRQGATLHAETQAAVGLQQDDVAAHKVRRHPINDELGLVPHHAGLGCLRLVVDVFRLAGLVLDHSR
jgi:hypothetical protein